jgi:hypothetical protein
VLHVRHHRPLLRRRPPKQPVRQLCREDSAHIQGLAVDLRNEVRDICGVIGDHGERRRVGGPLGLIRTYPASDEFVGRGFFQILLKSGFVVALHTSLLPRNHPHHQILKDVLIQQLHAVLFTRLNHRRNLMDLVLTDEVGDRVRSDHDLHGRTTTLPVLCLQENRRHHALQ